MQVSLTNLEGSGSVEGNSLFNYSYSEDVTTLEPSTLDGGTSQVSASGIANEIDKVGTTHPNSKLLINNTMRLAHSDGGSVDFSVKQLSVNAGAVSVIGNTIMDKLNKEVNAAPYGSIEGFTLLGAIDYYCGLAGFTIELENLVFEDDLDVELDLIEVNFIGWNGNLWDHLKMLCSAVGPDLEMYTSGSNLVFRKAKTTNVAYGKRDVSSSSVEVSMFDAAQNVSIYRYETEYKTDSVVHDLSGSRSGLFTANENVSISDSLQVDAGQTLVKRFTIDASLESVNQPDAVNSILPLPYTGGQGQYAIAGNDGILLNSAQWQAQGGSLTVALTENPNEIEITITAPPLTGLETADLTGIGYSPYKIGVETADGTDYPALYITGTGVFYKKSLYSINTGASEDYTSKVTSPVIDNLFITDLGNLYKRGTMAAQVACGPNVVLTESVPSVQEFGTTPGKMRTVDSNKYRVTSVNYAAEGTGITARASASFADFNSKWSGLSIADFNDTAVEATTNPNGALKFNEFTVIPLMEPQA